MAKTQNVTFPTWTAIEDSVQISTPDSMALYIGDQLSVDAEGDSFSIIAVISIDVLEDKNIFELKPDISTNFHMIGLGMRNVIEAGGYLFELTIHRPDSGFDTYSLFFAYDADTDTESNLQINTPYHLCITNKNVTVGTSITEISLKSYVNGKQMSSDIGSNFPWLVADGPVNFLHMEAQLKIGAVRIYDKILSPLIVKQNYEKASSLDGLVVDDIESFTITGVQERELNGYFDVNNSATMLTGTTGSYKILNAKEESSRKPDPITGLPVSGLGHWGSTCSIDGFVTSFTVFSVSGEAPVGPFPGPGDVTMVIDAAANPTVGATLSVKGVYIYSTESIVGTASALESSHTITSVGTALGGKISVVFEVPSYANSVHLVQQQQAIVAFDYPKSFSPSIDIAGKVRTMEHTFSPLVEGKPYTVRVRGIGTAGLISPWVEGSTIAGQDTAVPNPIYTSVQGLSNGRLQVSVNYDTTEAGVTDLLFHTETNIAKLQIVVCGETVDRFSGLGDPGINTADTDIGTNLGRRVLEYSLPRNISNLREQSFILEDMSASHDLYVWTRLITTSGTASEWFPNDSGDASLRDRFGVPIVPIGLGPVYVEEGSIGNYVSSTSSTSTTVDTTTAPLEGPASATGSGGVFNDIP